MKFFFDNCLPLQLAQALHALLSPDHEITHLRSRFPANTSDLQWIRTLMDEGGWIIVTTDDLLKVEQQRQLLRNSGLITIIVRKGWNQKLLLQAARFLYQWESILEALDGIEGTAFFDLPFKGKIQRTR